jgi:hypothetical protein
MLELLDGLRAWQLLIVAVAVYGFFPGVVLRFILLAFRRSDPRRAEILAELRAVARWERPFWVAEQAEVALFEGLLERIKSRLFGVNGDYRRVSVATEETSVLASKPILLFRKNGPVVFTGQYVEHNLHSKKEYLPGLEGMITKMHTGPLGGVSHLDIRLGDSEFVIKVPVEYFRA